MLKKGAGQNFIQKILQDKKIQQEWQKKYKTEQSQLLSSDSEQEISKEVLAVRTKVNQIAELKLQKTMSKPESKFGIELELKNKIAELTEVKNYAKQLIQHNLMFKKEMVDLGTALKDMYLQACGSFKGVFEDKWSAAVEDSKYDSMTIVRELKRFMSKLAESQGTPIKKLTQQLEIAIAQKNNIQKINQRLLAHIQQRKAYTESLKQKITKLKDQIKIYEQEGQKKTSSEINMDTIEEKLDIKYMNRSDLIMIVKSLMQKIKKHSRECRSENCKIGLEELEKFCPKDLASAIKRSNSRNNSRQKQRANSRNGSRQKNIR